MRDRRIATVQLLALVLMLVSSGLVGKMTRATANSQSGPQTEGQLWLSWSSDTKGWYVGGFLEGFMEGKRAGCSYYADKIAPLMPNTPVPIEKLPKIACLNDLPDFPDSTPIYVEAITAYYTKYPHDRQAGKAIILLELASPPSLTIDQIHAKLTGNPKPD